MSFDALAMQAAHGQGALDVKLGEILLRLFEGDRLLQLGYARQTDYSKERLGVSVRLMLSWTALARGLTSRPILRAAVLAGSVTASKARVVMEAAQGEREATWTAAAMGMKLGELEKCVREGGFDSATDSFEIESIVLRMTPKQQDRLDAALKLAEEVVGPATPVWLRLEAIGQEWLAERGELDSRRSLEVQPWSEPMRGELPEDLPTSAIELDARARALVRRRVERDEELGRYLEEILRTKEYKAYGFPSFEAYVRDRLGMSSSSGWQRVSLERKMQKLPPLRAALLDGRLTLTKAFHVAKLATPSTVDEMIADAAGTTFQQLDREATEAEDLQNRAEGKKRLWGPSEVIETILCAIEVARRSVGSDGEALAVIADHFVAVWRENREPKRISRARKRILERHGGYCGVPGCSVPAAHEHHIIHRSQGGSIAIENRVALCAAHHLHAVHGGYMTVEGRAGEWLAWRITQTGEAWITEGDDNVRKEVGPASINDG